jgi:mRNA interferase MazF
MITSAAHRRWVGDVEIGDLGAAGLPAASIVRTVKIATVEDVTARRLGTLDEETRLALGDSIPASLR